MVFLLFCSIFKIHVGIFIDEIFFEDIIFHYPINSDRNYNFDIKYVTFLTSRTMWKYYRKRLACALIPSFAGQHHLAETMLDNGAIILIPQSPLANIPTEKSSCVRYLPLPWGTDVWKLRKSWLFIAWSS